MKTIFLVLGIFFLENSADAQFTSASLQASGLTCSMCSKAVKNALEEVNFVEKVQVDIKNQQYNLSFKKGDDVDFDALSKAVVDAGFAVADMKVTVDVKEIKADKDAHFSIGDKYFHLLNASGKQLKGPTKFTIVDKQFVSAKMFKKYAMASQMSCVKTGRVANCCTKNGFTPASRVYHVII